ncbi:sensor histidine kinase [Rhodocytophaga rosea]|uniref:Sensor histidine kinase n=1 Tax=Rhodocytophaga rosea TaxID=2704465 RepID=A0A6C0GNE7_9BACT|nr:histidine kinase [Rhodocytophaga rosea]QHT69457.1 sensor histidine kinase [Rhodocytophaga rosea]
MSFPLERFFYGKYKLPIHILFWGIVLLFYTIFYGHQRQEYYKTFVYVCLLLPVTMGITYLMIYFLIPRFLLKRRYGLFSLLFSYTLLLSVWLESIIISIAFITIAEYKVANLNPATFDIFFLIVSMYLVVFLAIAIKLLKQWHVIQQANHLLANARLEAELKLKEAELSLLKAQIHPHFLFNTLNNLYGLTLEKSEEAPEIVLKISALLDYLLYKCNSPKVALTQEIEYIQNYLSLEKLRYNENLEVHFIVKGKVKHKLIAPMLILPFVENSFKHGVSHELDSTGISINILVEGNCLQLQVINSKVPGLVNTPQQYTSGIGLQNVKKRLDLLYADKYQLNILDQETQYQVQLKLELQESQSNVNTYRII